MPAKKAKMVYEPVSINVAKFGDCVNFIDLLSAGARFYGEQRGELEAFAHWREMGFELVDIEKEFYRRFE